MAAATSTPFNIIIETQKVYKNQVIKYEGNVKMITNIKEVERLPYNKLRVSGTWKPEYINELLNKYSRNK